MQGERKDIASLITSLMENQFPQETMMRYLISIRQEMVSELEVLQVAQKISEMQN